MPAAAKLRWKKVREASRELATGASQSFDDEEEEAEATEEVEDEAAATAASARSPMAEAKCEASPLKLLLLETATLEDHTCWSASVAACACETAS